jgi:hypothetical protein
VPDVQLVEDEVGEVVSPEAAVRPREHRRIDDDRRAVDALGLVARGGIRPVALTVQAVLVPGAGGEAGHRLEGAVVLPRHGERAAPIDDDLHAPTPRGPRAEDHAVRAQRGAQMKACAK